MKLLGINIKKLHGYYSYNVALNEDITFLYGGNGSGKTTILNIISMIIRGEIYQLFNYEFEEIILNYINENTEENIIVKSDKKDREKEYKEESNFNFFKRSYYLDNRVIELYYNNNSYLIREDEIKSMANRYTGFDLKIRLFEMYPVLSEISRKFNHAYIPIENTRFIHESEFDNFSFGSLIKREEQERLSNERNNIVYVEDIIRNEINKINNGQNKIMGEFRNNVLKSLVDVNKSSIFNVDLNLTEYIESFNLSKEDILKIGYKYIDMLGYMEIIDDETKKDTIEFFSKVSNLKGKIDGGLDNLKLDEIWKLSLCFDEIEKLKKIVELSENMEEEIRELSDKMDRFLATINEFLNLTLEKKTAIIKDNKLYFHLKDTESYIDINRLSSGEKQIIIFFASLIFTLNKDESSIFLVDEPEISLHLAWQNKYVDKILEIAPNIQIIFATHSPEIISKHYNKVVKLERKIE